MIMQEKVEIPSFLESDMPPVSPEEAMFHVIPVPYERTVSYGGGTADGPAAILHASGQLEVYDGTSRPAEHGIYTSNPVSCSGNTETVLHEIVSMTRQACAVGAVPVVLGGEHTVTFGAVKAVVETHSDVGIIQFDAHADLRDSYEGTPWSHACVMRRILELDVPIAQFGVRALSWEEEQLRQDRSVFHLDAALLADEDGPDELLPIGFPKKIYITFDVDALDPSIIPATGTPVPGGLQWYQTMTLLDYIINGREVVGFDVVELAPQAYHHASSFAAAQLVYNLMGMVSRAKRGVTFS